MNNQYEPSRIVKCCMGSFLDAPKYPTHNFSIEIDLKKKPENRGSMNLDYALTETYISPEIKNKIKKLISDWEAIKPAIGSEEFNVWVDACIKHWGSLKAALSHIQRFYPDFNK